MKFKIKEIKTEDSPIEIFEKVKGEKSIFLDSSKIDGKLSKYSFIGLNSIEVFESKNNYNTLNGEFYSKENPFKALKRRSREFELKEDIEIPFIGGYIGFISYDTGRVLEKLPDSTKSDIEIPDMRFILYRNIIIIDHINKRVFITAILDKLDESIEEIIEKLQTNIIKEEGIERENNIFTSNFNEKSYIEAVKKMRNYIEEGHIYIANMTQRFKCTCNKEGFEIYKALRKINGAPFSAYVNYEDFEIISSSPERFIQIVDGLAHTRPIKGTRPRGRDEKEDDYFKNQLINSEKDKSELLMIVDLERNDFNKVCEKGSVKVTELFKIEEYSTVFHLVSQIEGKLKEEYTAIDCIEKCFPGGSITGAPKIRAMEIIEELEGVKRNLYTGSIGYFDLRGNCDFNIVIRTIVKKDNEAYFGVGGGVTYESNEKDEYDETLQKAKALMRVLK